MKKWVTIIPQPHLTAAAFEQLMDKMHLAGHQEGKDRGTMQSDTLKQCEPSARAPSTPTHATPTPTRSATIT